MTLKVYNIVNILFKITYKIRHWLGDIIIIYNVKILFFPLTTLEKLNVIFNKKVLSLKLWNLKFWILKIRHIYLQFHPLKYLAICISPLRIFSNFVVKILLLESKDNVMYNWEEGIFPFSLMCLFENNLFSWN